MSCLAAFVAQSAKSSLLEAEQAVSLHKYADSLWHTKHVCLWTLLCICEHEQVILPAMVDCCLVYLLMVEERLMQPHHFCLEQHAALWQLGFLCLTDFAADAGTALVVPCLHLEQGCHPLRPPYIHTGALLT